MNEGSSMNTEPGLSEMATDQLHSLRATVERRLKETAGHNKAMRLEEEIAAITEEIRVRGDRDRGRFVLEIEPGNVGMQDAGHVSEALRKVAGRLDFGKGWEGDGVVQDANGNTVGRWTFHDHN